MEIGGKQLPSCRPPISYLTSIRQRPFLSCECEQKNKFVETDDMPRCTLPRQEICIEGKLDVRTVDTRQSELAEHSAHLQEHSLAGTKPGHHQNSTMQYPDAAHPFLQGCPPQEPVASKNLSTVSFGASRFRRSGVCSKFPTRVKNSDGFPSSSPSLLLRRHGSKRRKEKLKKAYCSFLVSLR